MELYIQQLTSAVASMLDDVKIDAPLEVEMRISGDVVTRNKIKKLIDSSFTYTKYTEERFVSSDAPSIKYRKRSGVPLESKASLFKYPLCWSKLHVSSEITHDYHPSHIILSESVKIKRYYKRLGGILIDIKIPANGQPTVEVELLNESGLDDFIEACFSLVSYFTNGTFIDRLTYDTSQLFFAELCKAVAIDPAANRYAKPVTMHHDDLIEVLHGDYYVTHKTNGTRSWLWGTDAHIFSPEIIGENPLGCWFLLDCEKVDNDKWVLLDVLFMKQSRTDILPFEKRLEIMKTLRLKNIRVKKYRRVKTVKDIEEFWRSQGEDDGVVLIENKPYMDSKLYKWKSDNTVDLQVRDDRLYAYNDTLITQWKYNVANLRNGIYEFSKTRYNVLVPIKRRTDKKFPNKIGVVKNNLLRPFNLFSDADTDTCRRMRKYHNDVKRNSLQLMASDTLLDIGSGKGGDILKWEKTYETVYCIEKDASLDPVFQERLVGRSVETKILYKPVADYENISKFIDLKKIMSVSIFFCMNMFDSDDFDGLSRILADLPNNARIAVIFFDYNMIKLMFGSSYTCKDYSISIFKGKLKISIAGTYVQNVVERPIDEDFVVSFMKQNGCKVFINQILDGDRSLTPQEMRLSMCYRYIMFAKLNNL
jgi:hypothetical protein